MDAIKTFFQSGKLLKESNATILTLGPKKPNPSIMGDFRPIACCNVVYKCITKILANRLLLGLDAVISNNQAAFMPLRSILENVLLSQELVRDYHKENGTPRCTLKVDLMKAYDSVNWEFILCCLQSMGAPSKFVHWIRECITNPTFSVAVNGTLVGYFQGGRGLIQGNPISPYLFIISMEVLAQLFVEAARNKAMDFHPRCSKLQLSHLCFVNDLLIFSAGMVKLVQAIKDVLAEFTKLSGLKANPDKSYVFCAGLPPAEKGLILDCHI